MIQVETFPDYVSARLREKFLKSGQGRAWLAEKFPKRLPVRVDAPTTIG